MLLSHLPLFLLLLLVLPNTPPAVAAASQLLQSRPFVVVWNIPTARCHKRYDIHLNLKDFDIVENQHQSFQGQVTHHLGEGVGGG